MINLKKYKNLTYIITIFSLIIFTFSLVTSIIVTDYKNANEVEGFRNSETKSFKFNNSEKIEFKSLLQVLDNYCNTNIYLEYSPIPKYLSNNTLFGRVIYYNYNTDNKIPVLEGNNFTLEQMNSDEKLILVGKNLKDNIIKEDNIDYFTVDDVKYKVIGILGSTNKKTGYDDTFLINMKSMEYESDKRSTWSLNVSDSKSLSLILNELTQIGNEKNALLKFVESSPKTTKIDLAYMVENYLAFIYVFGMVLGFGILNLIIVVYFWIDKSIKEIGVRKAYGATNISIAKHILKRYELSIIISVIIGLALHFIFKEIINAMFPKLSFDIYFENVLVATIVFMFIGLLVAIIPFIKAKKVQPVIIMKGKLK